MDGNSFFTGIIPIEDMNRIIKQNEIEYDEEEEDKRIENLQKEMKKSKPENTGDDVYVSKKFKPFLKWKKDYRKEILKEEKGEKEDKVSSVSEAQVEEELEEAPQKGKAKIKKKDITRGKQKWKKNEGDLKEENNAE